MTVRTSTGRNQKSRRRMHGDDAILEKSTGSFQESENIHTNTRNTELKKNKDRRSSKRGVIIFGDVRVAVPQVTTDSEFKHNIKQGQYALARARSTLLKRGVALRTAKNVALYHADPDNPDFIVRVKEGKSERGRFVKGCFRKVPQ